VALFGITAVLLAAVGIFGVTARNVALRTRELGIRAALGATGQGLIGMVLRGSLMTAITGTAVGLAGALLVSRLLEGFLFEVETTDPLTHAAVVSLLAGVCFVASYLPTRRVAKVNPVVVLRAE
jgi:ABC-type antimicrobial peptide transport system permease subunit